MYTHVYTYIHIDLLHRRVRRILRPLQDDLRAVIITHTHTPILWRCYLSVPTSTYPMVMLPIR